MMAGVAISPDTPSTAITDEVANAADMLLVMTVYPGISSLFHQSRLPFDHSPLQVGVDKNLSRDVFQKWLNYGPGSLRRILRLMAV